MIRKFLIGISLFALASVSVSGQQVGDAEKELAKSSYLLAVAGIGGYMGVGIKDVSSRNFESLGLSEVKGVAITSVMKDSAAEKAGLTKGDVIVAIDGQKVTSTTKFRRIVREIAPDHTVNLTVARGGSEVQIPLTMGSRKTSSFVGDRIGRVELLERLGDVETAINVPRPQLSPSAIFSDGVESMSIRTSRAIGVGVTRLTKQLGDYFGVVDGNGVLINEVSKDGPAERAGLRAGDIITKVDDKPVKRTFDLMRYMGDEGDVTITFVRDRSEQTVTVTPEKRKGNYFYFKTKKEDKEEKDN